MPLTNRQKSKALFLIVQILPEPFGRSISASPAVEIEPENVLTQFIRLVRRSGLIQIIMTCHRARRG